eukprot:TRINITY_DN239_c0_g1_i1.p2 TRINITY_DN239_c0_g1~~TRINITY_DN239_c0_g1_i1.p2  ORF type:complete len:145 (-),score=59.65 TRINITY_DN239_c0_g1_i1:126-560(-)
MSVTPAQASPVAHPASVHPVAPGSAQPAVIQVGAGAPLIVGSPAYKSYKAQYKDQKKAAKQNKKDAKKEAKAMYKDAKKEAKEAKKEAKEHIKEAKRLAFQQYLLANPMYNPAAAAQYQQQQQQHVSAHPAVPVQAQTPPTKHA